MTQLEIAKKGNISPEMEAVAKAEGLDVEVVRQRIAEGTIVIPANVKRTGLVPCGIGKGLSTKTNANIGTSPDFGDVDTELEKLRVAEDAGVDAVMDLSTGADIPAIRREIMAAATCPIGTVPIYQAGIEAIERYGAIVKMTVEEVFAAIEDNARETTSVTRP